MPSSDMTAPFCISTNSEQLLLFCILSAFVLVRIADFDHCSRCVVVFHCFNLYFPVMYSIFYFFIIIVLGVLCDIYLSPYNIS
jgi:hypothetical protein